MVFILVIVIGLVAWALHLMQQAVESREFSLMLAGFLVSTAAAGLMAVYFLMGHYIGYMAEMSQRAYLSSQIYDAAEWAPFSDRWLNDNLINVSSSSSAPMLREQ
jgi:cytochrome b subunit of formate dehydrogenase